MDTLWGFVEAAWVNDSALVHHTRNETWSKPELLSGSFELRRVTTREAATGDRRRFDFFEYYWAHRMQGHTLGGLVRWTLGLFIRPSSAVPPDLRPVWALGLMLLALAVGVALLAAVPEAAAWLGLPPWLLLAASVLSAAGAFFVNAMVLPHAGDAARYLSPEPDNVDVRQHIRAEGVALIEKLTASGAYDRIVLVGHSLGSVIAHDILNFAWTRLEGDRLAKVHAAEGMTMAALANVEQAALNLEGASDAEVGALRSRYRDAQRSYAAALANAEMPIWIVSDLVTLGSPLSKADILIGRNAEDLRKRISRREIPICPPALEEARAYGRFSYPVASDVRRPHHGAVFAPVVWTNLYYSHAFILFGDIISGPVRHLFGRGVLDVRLPIGSPPGFRHLDYWRGSENDPVPAAILALRNALNLSGVQRDAALWAEQADAAEINANDLTREN